MHIYKGRHDGGRGRGARNLFGCDQHGRRDFGPDERHGLFGGRGHHGGHHRGRDGERMGDDRGPGGRGPGGRRGKRFSGDELRLMVLSLLDGEPQHGYQLIRGFAEKSGDAYAPSPGVLYPLLTLLADMGLVEEMAGDAANPAGGRRNFGLTDLGRAELAAQRPIADAAFQRLTELAGETRRTDPAPVRRAMMNLRTAAVQRLSSGDGYPELGFRIAEILDEAARTIERLKGEA